MVFICPVSLFLLFKILGFGFSKKDVLVPGRKREMLHYIHVLGHRKLVSLFLWSIPDSSPAQLLPLKLLTQSPAHPAAPQ